MQIQPRSIAGQPLSQGRSRPPGAYYPDILLGLLLLAAPFLLFPRGYGLLALLLLPLLWLIRWGLTGHFVPRTPLDGPVLLLLAALLASLWATFDLSFSIGKISSLLLGVVIYYAVIDLSRSKAAFQRVMAGFIVAGLGITLLAALGTHWAYKFPFIQPALDSLPEALRNVRGAEAGFNPNQVGGVLIFFIPLQVMLCGYWLKALFSPSLPGETSVPEKPTGISKPTAAHQKFRPGSFLGLGLTGLALLATGTMLLLSQSRGALGGLAAGLLAVAALRTSWGKALGFMSLVLLAGFIYLNGANALVGSGLETEVAGVIRLDGRLEIWSRAAAALADFPLGLGMNNFRRVMPLLYPATSVRLVGDVAHAHNHLLQAGLDLGLPGLVAYLSLWLGAAFMLWQVIRQTTQDGFYQAAAWGLFGGLLAHFTYGLTDAVALGAKPGFIFWWTLGLVAAIYQLSIQVKQ